MTKNTVGLSDADVARALSRRLSGLESGDSSATAASSPFLRFAPAAADAVASTTGDSPVADQPLNDFTRWDEFLAWALNTVRSSAAFAVDPQGFVIGSSGNVPEDGFEGTGAELSYVMSQADAMDPEKGGLKSVALEFADIRVSGFRADFGDAGRFIVAFVDADGFTAESREQVARQLKHSFGVLM